MYLNLKGFSLPHGLGVGGSVDTGFRLWIPESLEGCVAGDRDASFAWGPLAGKTGGGKGGREGEFEMEGLEVWGVGGEEAIEAACNAQGEARQMMADNIARARRVDKSKFVDNDFDKEFLLGKTFGQGKRERRGRD
ncbi:TLDc [Nannochloropsis gaditana]|uniref:TLDc n=1 Tax=Nannochloropsis gaditana TaxID=72520 RepID=W7T4N8_9STRA|nr:TLDc [Nannochloropsis gaditana]